MLTWAQIAKVLYFFGFCFFAGFVYLMLQGLMEDCHNKKGVFKDE